MKKSDGRTKNVHNERKAEPSEKTSTPLNSAELWSVHIPTTISAFGYTFRVNIQFVYAQTWIVARQKARALTGLDNPPISHPSYSKPEP